MLTVKGVLKNGILTTDDGKVLEVCGMYCSEPLHGYFQLNTDMFGHLQIIRSILTSL